MSHKIQFIGHSDEPRQKRPRLVNNAHLAFIRQLSCAICARRPVDPAHLRTGCRLLGKRETGVAEKPSDLWTTPLCREHHDEQHRMGELDFWTSHNILNPFAFALALFAASVAEDVELANSIVAEHRHLVMGLTI